MSLKGKTIVVTGASKGLGLAIVRRLCEEGADIIAHFNSGDISQAQALAEEPGFNSGRTCPGRMRCCAWRSRSWTVDRFTAWSTTRACACSRTSLTSPESFDFTFYVNVKADLRGRIPLKRCGNPENIADAVVYFLGERTSWTTGTTLPVDGGYQAK